MVIIEKLKDDDKPAVLSLLKQANMHYIPSQEMPEITWENYFVARLDDKVIGFAGYKILSPTEAKTELMVVDRAYRGLGVGYRLQQQRMEDMLAKGIRSLTTNTDLPETIEWYKRKFGYQKIGTLKKYHEFSDPYIPYWTTLHVDLMEWQKRRDDRKSQLPATEVAGL